MSKNKAPGMCLARYSALALRPLLGRCMEPSSTTSPGVLRRSASQPVCTIHLSFMVLVPPGCSGERDADAPVQLALLLDLGDGRRPDLAGALDVCAAARLQVDGPIHADGDQPHPARAHRRPH